MAPRRKLDRFLLADTMSHLRRHELASEPSNGWVVVKRAAFSYFNGYFPKEARTIEVPEFVQSVQTFEYLELTYGTARKLYQAFVRYNNNPNNVEMSVLQWAKEHVLSVPGDACGKYDDWAMVMSDIGLNKQWKDHMWASNWDGKKWYSRERSLKEEVLDMMEARYKELAGLDKRIRDKYDEELHEREGTKTFEH